MCESFQEGEDGLIEFIEMASEVAENDPDQDDIDEVEKCFDDKARPGVEKMNGVLVEYANVAFVGREKEEKELDLAADELDEVMNELKEMGWRE